MRLLLLLALVLVSLVSAFYIPDLDKRGGSSGAWFLRPAWRPVQKRMFPIPLFTENYDDWETPQLE